MTETRELGVAVIGFGWMGQVHSRAWSRLLQHYPDSPLRPRLVAVADPDEGQREKARSAYGFAHAYDAWPELLERDDSPDPRFNLTKAELDKRGIKDFQLYYALQTLKRLGTAATPRVASGGAPTRSR